MKACTLWFIRAVLALDVLGEILLKGGKDVVAVAACCLVEPLAISGVWAIVISFIRLLNADDLVHP